MDNECSAKIVILDTKSNVKIELHCVDVIAAVKLEQLLKQTDSYNDNSQYQFSVETI